MLTRREMLRSSTALCLSLGQTEALTEEVILDQLKARWDASAAYTLAIADQMPDTLYSYRPTSAQMTFAQQLLHIADNFTSIFSEIGGRAAPSSRSVEAKPAVMSRLRDAYDFGSRVLQDRKTPGTLADRLNGVMLALDHTTHHRGQLVVYLRLQGIVPREYRR